tara:strand:- start:465 stop:740 length:276 start_codon:yes stop_codon:yes gene_type:complete
MNPQFGFGMFQKFLAPYQTAGNAGADLKMIFPWFLKLIHGVEGDHSLHMGFGNFTDFGYIFNGFFTQPTSIFLLGKVEQWEQSIPLNRITA